MRLSHLAARTTAVGLLALLAACSTAPVGDANGDAVLIGVAQPMVQQPSAADLAPCTGAPYLRLIGQDVTALERELILREIRILRPHEPITRDLRVNRLNFFVDAQNRIERVSCG